MGMHVLCVGNPFDGIRIYGPFATGEEANEFADEQKLGDWWAVPLLSPSELEGA